MNFECRICLSAFSNENHSLLDSCEVKDGSKTVKEMISYCCSIEILDSTLLPQRVCRTCFKNLKQACDLKTECIQSHFRMKERLSSQKDAKLEPREIKVETLLPLNDSDVECDNTGFQEDESEDLNTQNLKLEFEEDDENFETESIDEKKESTSIHEEESQPKGKKKKLFPQNCPDCGKVFLNKKAKKHHKKNIFNQCNKGKADEFKCYICSKIFTKRKLKEEHLKIDHKDDKTFVCPICNCEKSSVKSLDSHIMYHFKEKEYCCETCGKSWETATRLKIHIKTIHEPCEKYVCDLCGRKIKNIYELKRHMDLKHLHKRLFSCKECGDAYSYTRRMIYLQHMYRFHNVEPPIRCPECNAGFTTSSELKRHKNKQGNCKKLKATEFFRYIGEDNNIRWKDSKTISVGIFTDKNYVCKVCNKTFQTTDGLLNHHRVKHEGLTYKCSMCDNVYMSRKGLENHKKTIHLNIYPFECDICSKKFVQKTAMERHRIIHTDLKPFSCSICSKEFNDRGSCRRHLKTVHKIEASDINAFMVKTGLK